MKIAEAMAQVKLLRKEYNDTDINPYVDGSEVIAPDALAEQFERKAAILRRIAELKSSIVKSNNTVTLNYNGSTLTLSYALNLLDSMREELTLLTSTILPRLKGATPTKSVMQGRDYVTVPLIPNFTAEDVVVLRNRAAQLETDIYALQSNINYTNWNSNIIT